MILNITFYLAFAILFSMAIFIAAIHQKSTIKVNR